MIDDTRNRPRRQGHTFGQPGFLRTRFHRFHWTNWNPDCGFKTENYHVPCPRCGSVEMEIEHVVQHGTGVEVHLHCLKCNARPGLGIFQSMDYAENGGAPLVQLATD